MVLITVALQNTRLNLNAGHTSLVGYMYVNILHCGIEITDSYPRLVNLG